jgi:hypothetical protein
MLLHNLNVELLNHKSQVPQYLLACLWGMGILQLFH